MGHPPQPGADCAAGKSQLTPDECVTPFFGGFANRFMTGRSTGTGDHRDGIDTGLLCIVAPYFEKIGAGGGPVLND